MSVIYGTPSATIKNGFGAETGDKLLINSDGSINANTAAGTPIAPNTGIVTSVAASATPGTLAALDTARIGATFFNDADKTLYLKLGSSVTTTSFTVKVLPGGYYEIPTFSAGVYSGVVTGVWDAAPTGSVRITQLTKV